MELHYSEDPSTLKKSELSELPSDRGREFYRDSFVNIHYCYTRFYVQIKHESNKPNTWGVYDEPWTLNVPHFSQPH